MEKESKRIDLRDEKFQFVSFHVDNGERVYQIVFTNTVVVLNEEQMERLES